MDLTSWPNYSKLSEYDKKEIQVFIEYLILFNKPKDELTEEDRHFMLNYENGTYP